MKQTLLNGADLTGATFQSSKIINAQMRDVNLTDTRWTRSMIANSDLRRVDLTGASMTSLICVQVDIAQIKTDDQVLKSTVDALGKKRGDQFNDTLTGIQSTAHGFTPVKLADLVRAMHPRR